MGDAHEDGLNTLSQARRILCTQAIEEDKDGTELRPESYIEHGLQKHKKDRSSCTIEQWARLWNLREGDMLGLGFCTIDRRNRVGGT
jgi:hypothetical protein